MPVNATPSTPTLTPTPSPTLTPTLTPTPNPTLTPTPTLTPSPTATPGITTCRVSLTVPQLGGAQGYWAVAQLSVPSYLDATWDLTANGKTNAELYIYSNSPTNPFANQPDPTSISPPSGDLVNAGQNSTSIEVRTPRSDLTGQLQRLLLQPHRQSHGREHPGHPRVPEPPLPLITERNFARWAA